jgi:small nuclear ribonucleoprotein (snRNP)-like protein
LYAFCRLGEKRPLGYKLQFLQNMSAVGRDTFINLGKPSLRRRLEAYYARVSPEQIENESTWKATFEKIWEKFGGSVEGEQKLATKLVKKYGDLVSLEIVVDPMAQEAAAASETNQQQNEGIRNVRDEDYYVISQEQRGSGIVSFTDPNFDPSAALTYSQDAVIFSNPWLKEASLLERVDQCRSLLPICDPLYKHPVKRTFKPPALDHEKPRKIKAPPAFVAIASHCKEGPLAVLYDAMMRRKRVRVLVRYANSIRGTLTGHLLAFDKHFNMLLKDVDEVYSPVLGKTTEGRSTTEIEVERRLSAYSGVARGEDWTCRHRRLGQLMVRGDVVVLVYRPEQEQSCRPRTRKSPTNTIYRQRSARKNVPLNQQVGTPGSLFISAHKNSGSTVSGKDCK